MKKPCSFFLCLIFCISIAYSADTSEIEALRFRSVSAGTTLSESEMSVINKFWTTSLDQMLLSESSQQIVEIRRELEKQKGNEHLSYYATAYIAQASESIQAAFENSQRFDNLQHRILIQRNLMILTGNLHSPQLAPLALNHLNSEDDVIRYWAVKAVTQPSIIQQLTTDVTRDEEMTETILTALKDYIVTELQPEITKMVVHFCMAFDHPAARDILMSIKDQRIKAYQNWTVKETLPDAHLLMALGRIAMEQSDAEIKQNFGRGFAELFALVMQRYLAGMETLPEDELEQMLTVIAKVDQEILDHVMGIRTGILQALRTKNISAIKREYEVLFGDRMRSGQLATIFKFDYGKDSTGRPITVPPELEPMPEKSTAQK